MPLPRFGRTQSSASVVGLLIALAAALSSLAACGDQTVSAEEPSLYSQDPTLRRAAFAEIAEAMPIPVVSYEEDFSDEPLPEPLLEVFPDGAVGEMRAHFEPSTEPEAFTDVAAMSAALDEIGFKNVDVDCGSKQWTAWHQRDDGVVITLDGHDLAFDNPPKLSMLWFDLEPNTHLGPAHAGDNLDDCLRQLDG